MDVSTPQPPLPSDRGNKRFWIIIGVVAVVLAIGGVAVLALGVFGMRRVQQQRAAARAATTQFQNTVAEERAKMAEMLRSGETSGGDAALGRLKDQLEKSADQLSSADAAAARAMASFMGKLQAQIRDYQAAATRFSEAQVFNPSFHDREAIEPQRQIVREFLAQNARLTETMQRSEAMLRAELEAEKVPSRTREETIAGFTRSRARGRGPQDRIRACDKALGETALAALDLLEKNWGKWRRDPAIASITFDDEATLAAYNALVEQVQATADEQTRAQEELARLMQSTEPR